MRVFVNVCGCICECLWLPVRVCLRALACVCIYTVCLRVYACVLVRAYSCVCVCVFTFGSLEQVRTETGCEIKMIEAAVSLNYSAEAPG